ncbi:MAG: TRAP transporter small permease [Alphaproteobacteria bacterium]|nr:TRAP transporter small permease [Alphaproteobacteria bacterium]
MRLGALITTAARLLAGAAALILAAMMMITVADILLRSVFAIPIFGTFDLVELFLVGVIFLAIPLTLLREEHVVVDAIDHVVSGRTRTLLRWTGAALALLFLLLMGLNMIQPALDTLAFGDRTLDLEIPKVLHWLPILVGIAVSILTLCVLLLRIVGGGRHDSDGT